MGESFFGFDATLRLEDMLGGPGLDGARAAGGRAAESARDAGGDADDDDLGSRLREFTLAGGDDMEIYDYDDLGDQLVETNDELNDETFGFEASETGKDFDFSGSTAKMAPTIDRELREIAAKPGGEPERPRGSPSNQEQRPDQQYQQRQVPLQQAPQFGYAAASSRAPPQPPQPRRDAEPVGAPRVNFASIWCDTDENSTWGAFSQTAADVKQPVSPSSSFAPSAESSRMLREAPFAVPPLRLMQAQQVSPPGTAFPRRPLTLEEVEAEVLLKASATATQAQMQQQLRHQQQHQQHQQQGVKMLSLEEVEGSFRENKAIATALAEAQEAEMEHRRHMDAERNRRRDERMRAMAEAPRYDGLMSKYDKDLIARIQISKLVSDDPYRDDFYYQVYTAIRSRHGLPPTGGPPLNAMGRVDSRAHGGYGRGAQGGMLRMQQQVQRIISINQRRKPKAVETNALQGALGKVTSSTSRTPRVLLQVKPKTASEERKDGGGGGDDQHVSVPHPLHKAAAHGKAGTAGTSRQVLSRIERVYDAVLKLEQLRREQPPVPHPDSPADVLDGFERWNRDYALYVKVVWKELQVVVPASSHPHPFIAFLSVGKGKKIIPRVLRHSLPQQILAMISVLVANFESLDCVSGAVYGPADAIPPPAQQSVELFMNTVVPTAVAFIGESPLRIVAGLLGLFLDRNNVAWVARGKIGLVFLTMFFSRAEILKEGGGALQGLPPPTEEEVAQWNEQYNRAFKSLQGHFLHLFPPASANVDNVYVWQFLASIAVGATLEQQHVLVTEVREKVLDAAAAVSASSGRLPTEKDTAKVANCNLFLHALGLDASQIVV